MARTRFWVTIDYLVGEVWGGGGKGGVYSFNGPYGEALLEKSTFFRPEVYKRVGVSLAEVYGRVGKSVLSAKGSNRANRDIKKKRKTLV